MAKRPRAEALAKENGQCEWDMTRDELCDEPGCDEDAAGSIREHGHELCLCADCGDRYRGYVVGQWA